MKIKSSPSVTKEITDPAWVHGQSLKWNMELHEGLLFVNVKTSLNPRGYVFSLQELESFRDDLTEFINVVKVVEDEA